MDKDAYELEQFKARGEMWKEAVRGLLIINGGGSVALLAFLQATWHESRILSTSIVFGLACLVTGALVAATIHPNGIQSSLAHVQGLPERSVLAARGRVRVKRSLVCFALGCAIVGIGALLDLFGDDICRLCGF